MRRLYAPAVNRRPARRPWRPFAAAANMYKQPATCLAQALATRRWRGICLAQRIAWHARLATDAQKRRTAMYAPASHWCERLPLGAVLPLVPRNDSRRRTRWRLVAAAACGPCPPCPGCRGIAHRDFLHAGMACGSIPTTCAAERSLGNPLQQLHATPKALVSRSAGAMAAVMPWWIDLANPMPPCAPL